MNLVKLTKDDGVSIVTISNPPLNVMNQEVAKILEKGCKRLLKNVILFSGIGKGGKNERYDRRSSRRRTAT